MNTIYRLYNLFIILLFMPSYTFAQSNDVSNKIGAKIVAVVLFMIGIAIYDWVKSKNRKDDHNQPL